MLALESPRVRLRYSCGSSLLLKAPHVTASEETQVANASVCLEVCRRIVCLNSMFLYATQADTTRLHSVSTRVGIPEEFPR